MCTSPPRGAYLAIDLTDLVACVLLLIAVAGTARPENGPAGGRRERLEAHHGRCGRHVRGHDADHEGRRADGGPTGRRGVDMLTLHPDGTTTGRFVVPGGDEDGGDLDVDLAGRWALSGNRVTLAHARGTVLRDLELRLSGPRLAAATDHVRLVLQR